ncbi:hypothetical protein AURDEDRAFT_151747 [Auricularia subglabra TFB-10046 SS5]|nr:hypothetical protein AURDEDRAFT_151747 [Auricularia subglabra TFB-10046 SS5]
MITTVAFLALASGAHAHVTAWAKGMYCKNGYSTTDNPNAADPVAPLWNLTTNDWFMHGRCRSFPPPAGEFLSIPANGKFTVELAGNRGLTTLSYNGQKATAWPDGRVHPANWSTNITDPNFPLSSAGCLGSPNLHAHGQIDAAGTAFAISYKGKGNIDALTVADFTVFSILPNTPFQRLATYSVPNLPVCPTGGCLCAWGWVPNHCGQSNMYMNAYRCQVTGAKSTAKPVGVPKVPVWCESNPAACVKGPKQLISVYQSSGNNVVLPGGVQKDGQWPSPGYNSKVGFSAGAQTDIFTTTSKGSSTTSKTTAKSTAATTSRSAVTSTAVVGAADSTVSGGGPTTSGTLVSASSAPTVIADGADMARTSSPLHALLASLLLTILYSIYL